MEDRKVWGNRSKRKKNSKIWIQKKGELRLRNGRKKYLKKARRKKVSKKDLRKERKTGRKNERNNYNTPFKY